MRGRYLSLLLPGLFGDPAARSAAGPAPGRLRPQRDAEGLRALRTLVSRADRVPGTGAAEPGSPESLLFQSLGVVRDGSDWPVAALTAREDGAAAGLGAWMRADPVHLEVGRAGLHLSDPRELALTREEADTLCRGLNEALPSLPGGIDRIRPLAPERWYLACDRPPRMATRELSLALGGPTGSMLPRGPEAGAWLRALTEIEMLLHGLPANRARVARGQPAVNSVWFWGAGVPPVRPETPPPVHLWSDAVLAKGLGRVLGTPYRALPADAAAWLEGAPEAGRHVVYCDALHHALRAGDRSAWQEGRGRWETRWFEPLRRALWSKALEGLRIEAGSGVAFEIPAAARWRWWRRGGPLPIPSPAGPAVSAECAGEPAVPDLSGRGERGRLRRRLFRGGRNGDP